MGCDPEASGASMVLDVPVACGRFVARPHVGAQPQLREGTCVATMPSLLIKWS